VALYGAEIWGVNKNLPISSFQASFYKRIFGIARSTTTCAILRETGSIDIITKARRRSLMYRLKCAKDLAPPLVVHCYRKQLKIGLAWVVTPWLIKVKDILHETGMSNLWEGQDINDKNVSLIGFTSKLFVI
jgi:hypothetical protein